MLGSRLSAAHFLNCLAMLGLFSGIHESRTDPHAEVRSQNRSMEPWSNFVRDAPELKSKVLGFFSGMTIHLNTSRHLCGFSRSLLTTDRVPQESTKQELTHPKAILV